MTPTRARGLSAFVAVVWLVAALAFAAAPEVPPAPARHFNDYASLVPPAEAERLDAKLRAFEQESGNQIVVAIFPKLPSPSLEDFTVRTAEAWRVGNEKLDNGAVLFVFVEDRKTRIETGYGLEARLTDALSERILQDTLRPHFREGRYAQGLESAVDAILQATRGAYTPPPRRQAARRRQSGGIGTFGILVFIAIVLWFLSQNTPRGRGRRDVGWYSGGWYTGGGFGGGGGWSSGGGGWSGGGFSGGGGSFGGGGASGDW